MRLLHLYVGIFIAPALLFFAFTGALQTFSLHETTRGSSYVPPQWAVVLGQIHKKQTSVVASHRPIPPATAASSNIAGHNSGPGEHKADQTVAHLSQPPALPEAQPATTGRTHHPLPLKIFFLVVSIGLGTSVLTGIFMSYQYERSPLVVTALLVAGAVVPIVLVFV